MTPDLGRVVMARLGLTLPREVALINPQSEIHNLEIVLGIHD